MTRIIIAALALTLSSITAHAGTLEDAKNQSGTDTFSINLKELAKGAKTLSAVEGEEAVSKDIKTLKAAPASAIKKSSRKKPARAQSKEDAKPLTCKTMPGTTLCRRLKKVLQAYSYNCTGAACYGLFDTMTRELRSFSREYERVAGWEPETKEDISDLAHKTATKICGMQLTGPADILTRNMLAANPALDILLEIQKGSKRESTKHCQISMN